ncbi:DUF4282 domain-containing protein [Nesterenkonia muleiensis]|uniref:DUF4282 domain-containing protein n=1 Tax=Nesterenkonia muleiensis TaxID=2282648 RepID=UPI000E71FE23|nr:DUF4282 domain-containing protein [Nesterenkonia muleiensis]
MTQPPQPPYGDQPPNPSYGEQPPQPQGDPNAYPSREAKTGPNAAGFFRALFDFSFKSFVTIKFAAIIYAIALLLIGALTLIGVVVAFVTMTEEVLAGFFILLMVLLAAPFYLIMIRLTLELYVSMIRTAQNTAATTSEIENLRWDLSQKN